MSDWRLTGQERYLSGAVWVRKGYRAPSARWEHDHCAFCWAKFMDPDFSPEHRRFVEEHPEVLTVGYTTVVDEARGDHWVCPTCFDDFAERFGWRVVEEEPGESPQRARETFLDPP